MKTLLSQLPSGNYSIFKKNVSTSSNVNYVNYDIKFHRHLDAHVTGGKFTITVIIET